MSGEALDAIFGIYVKNAAQRCVRELCRCSVALFPGSVLCCPRGREAGYGHVCSRTHGFEKLIALLGFEKLIALPGAGKQGHRAPTELSNTALCSIFYVDSENGIESLPGPRFASKIYIFAHFG